MIGILNSPHSNVASVTNALDSLNLEWRHVWGRSDFRHISSLILPGVGTYPSAMNYICDNGIDESLDSFIEKGSNVLGICLGMQLLFASSSEIQNTNGLGLLEGTVETMRGNGKTKIPHIGWNTAQIVNENTLFKNVPEEIDFYFANSFSCHPSNQNIIKATYENGGTYVAVVEFENIYGVQFHPEKSQLGGIRILKNFATKDAKC
jgi:imidazole glycerol-phosphate synthase subunit HisH